MLCVWAGLMTLRHKTQFSKWFSLSTYVKHIIAILQMHIFRCMYANARCVHAGSFCIWNPCCCASAGGGGEVRQSGCLGGQRSGVRSGDGRQGEGWEARCHHRGVRAYLYLVIFCCNFYILLLSTSVLLCWANYLQLNSWKCDPARLKHSECIDCIDRFSLICLFCRVWTYLGVCDELLLIDLSL